MRMQQHLFWKKEKGITHGISTVFTGIFIYEIFIYQNARDILGINPFFKKITGFDGTTNSKFPEIWMCQMINKNFMSLIHLNTEKKYVIVYTVNTQELTSSTVSEHNNQIFNFFKISILAYVNIRIKIENSRLEIVMLKLCYAKLII